MSNLNERERRVVECFTSERDANATPPSAAPVAQEGDFIDKAAAGIPADVLLAARAEQAEEELRCADALIDTLRAQLAESEKARERMREVISAMQNHLAANMDEASIHYAAVEVIGMGNKALAAEKGEA